MSKKMHQVILKKEHKIDKMLQKCLHGIKNMAKYHTNTYQKEKTEVHRKKERLPSAGVNIYICIYISASCLHLEEENRGICTPILTLPAKIPSDAS